MTDVTASAYSDTLIGGGSVFIDGGIYQFTTPRSSYSDSDLAGVSGSTVLIDGGSTLRSVKVYAYDTTIKDATLNYSVVEIKEKLTLGEKDGVVSTTTPTLRESDLTTIDNTQGKIFNFYDGIVIGPNDKYNSYYNEYRRPIEGLVSDVETGYSIFKEIDGNSQKKYLTTDPIVTLSSNNTDYRTLAEAIADANAGDTITYLRDVTIPTSGDNTIINKDVIIDINGKNIDSDAQMITNNASITLKDSLGTGNIKFYDLDRTGIINNGTMSLENISLNAQVDNSSTMNVTNSTITRLLNTGTITADGMNGTKVVTAGSITFANNSTNTIETIQNTGTLSGYGLNNNQLNNSGSLNLTNSSFVSIASSSATGVRIDDSTITAGTYSVNSFNGLESNNLTINKTLSVSGVAVIDGFTGNLSTSSTNIQVTNSNFSLDNTGTISLDSTNTLTSISNDGNVDLDGVTSGTIYNSGTLNVTKTTISGRITNVGVTNYSQTTLTNNSDYSRVDGYAGVVNSGEFYMESGSISASGEGIKNTGKLVLGVRDGNVDGSIPSINGTIGVTGNVTAFYDGIVTGSTESISGFAIVVEDDYELKKDEDQGLQRAYLIQASQGEARVAVVNNINYTSLQAAINACGTTPCDVILYANIELDEPVTVPAGADVTIYLNYRNIIPESYVTNHSGTGNIRIHSGIPGGIAGAIYRFFADITGTEINPKNVIIYNMDDGNSLKENETYKLYKLMDGMYKIVYVNEEELGEYTVGSSTEEMNVIKGKLYLNGLGSGSYKIVSDTNRELDFEIEENGVSSNIRENTSSQSAKVISSSVAIVVLQFATGVARIPWILIILAIMAILSILFVIISKKKEK